MKWVPALSAALAVSVLVIACVVVGVNALALTVVGTPFFALGLLVSDGAVRRDRAVRRLVCTGYASGAEEVGLADLVRVLGTRDVVAARSVYLRAEETRLREAYWNGDASDY